jgi:hypothetical protein
MNNPKQFLYSLPHIFLFALILIVTGCETRKDLTGRRTSFVPGKTTQSELIGAYKGEKPYGIEKTDLSGVNYTTYYFVHVALGLSYLDAITYEFKDGVLNSYRTVSTNFKINDLSQVPYDEIVENKTVIKDVLAKSPHPSWHLRYPCSFDQTVGENQEKYCWWVPILRDASHSKARIVLIVDARSGVVIRKGKFF